MNDEEMPKWDLIKLFDEIDELKKSSELRANDLMKDEDSRQRSVGARDAYNYCIHKLGTLLMSHYNMSQHEAKEMAIVFNLNEAQKNYLKVMMEQEDRTSLD